MGKDNAASKPSCTDTSNTQLARRPRLRRARRDVSLVRDFEIGRGMIVDKPGIDAGQ